MPWCQKIDMEWCKKCGSIWHVMTSLIQVYDFLSSLKDLQWMVPSSYVNNPQPHSDFCWAELPDEDDGNVIESDLTEIVAPTKVEVFFRQPCNFEDQWVRNNSTIGSTDATIYRTSSTLVGEEETFGEHFLESIYIGFRGMSGAIAISPISGKCMGIFVRRGSLIPFKEVKTSADPLSTIYPRAVRGFLGLDRLSLGLDKLEAKTDQMSLGLDRIEAKTDRMSLEMLMKPGLKEVGTVCDARRGSFLPTVATPTFMSRPAVRIADLVGKEAPIISRQ
eukprot:gene8971-18565_t